MKKWLIVFSFIFFSSCSFASSVSSSFGIDAIKVVTIKKEIEHSYYEYNIASSSPTSSPTGANIAGRTTCHNKLITSDRGMISMLNSSYYNALSIYVDVQFIDMANVCRVTAVVLLNHI
jgi:hypothetical protein